MSSFRNSPEKNSSPAKSERQSNIQKVLTGRFGGHDCSTDLIDSPSLIKLARPGDDQQVDWRINTFHVPFAASDTLQAIPSELPLFITPATSEEVKHQKLALKSQKSEQLVYKKTKNEQKTKTAKADKLGTTAKKDLKTMV
jgi:hypothetical protein